MTLIRSDTQSLLRGRTDVWTDPTGRVQPEPEVQTARCSRGRHHHIDPVDNEPIPYDITTSLLFNFNHFSSKDDTLRK